LNLTPREVLPSTVEVPTVISEDLVKHGLILILIIVILAAGYFLYQWNARRTKQRGDR